MSVVEVLAAAVVGVALLWLVAQPLLSPLPALPQYLDPLDPEETPRGQALLALKEIEFDRATGKLSDADYTLLHARYAAAAIDVLGSAEGALSGVPDATAASALPAKEPPSTDPPHVHSSPRCTIHGLRSEPEALFCPECGLGLVTDAGACVACGVAILADARFCAGCGVPISA